MRHPDLLGHILTFAHDNNILKSEEISNFGIDSASIIDDNLIQSTIPSSPGLLRADL